MFAGQLSQLRVAWGELVSGGSEVRPIRRVSGVRQLALYLGDEGREFALAPVETFLELAEHLLSLLDLLEAKVGLQLFNCCLEAGVGREVKPQQAQEPSPLSRAVQPPSERRKLQDMSVNEAMSRLRLLAGEAHELKAADVENDGWCASNRHLVCAAAHALATQSFVSAEEENDPRAWFPYARMTFGEPEPLALVDAQRLVEDLKPLPKRLRER